MLPLPWAAVVWRRTAGLSPLMIKRCSWSRCFSSSSSSSPLSSDSTSAPVDLHYQEFPGIRTNAPLHTPLVIAHGLLGSHANWRSFGSRAEYSKDRRVFSVDLRNHGASPHSPHWNFQALANDFIRFFDRHEIEKAILMGHSLGGKAAMTTALLYPDRVEKLIVADMSPHTYKVNADSMMQVKTILSSMHGVDLSMMKTRNDVDKYLAPFIPDITVRRFILQNLALSSTANFSKPPQSGGEKMGMQWRPNIAVLLEKYHMLTDSDCTDYVNGKLASASVYSKPVLFVKGGKSDYITEHSTADIMYLFPNSTIHIIPQAAHWVHIDSPEDYVKCTHAFITS